MNISETLQLSRTVAVVAVAVIAVSLAVMAAAVAVAAVASGSHAMRHIVGTHLP
jgi:hypothetical protein